LGTLPYAEALTLQREHREAVLAGDADPVLFLLEHPPTLTTGRRPPPGLAPAAFWRQRGVDYFETERGGLATYHGPGQLVGYLICRLEDHHLSVRAVVEAIEEGLICWLRDRGVEASRREGFPGAWVGRQKIAAIGLNVHRGVTLHGFALNLTVDLEPFTWFVPCGISDGGVTRLADLLPGAPTPAEAAREVGDSVVGRLRVGRQPQEHFDGSGMSR
jgi:lipoyl(octanoyl) transferase